MYDIGVAVEKFEELIELAEQAESRFEKAAVFAATVTLSERFVGEDEWRYGLIDVNPSYLTAVEEARYNICAAVGYDLTQVPDARTYLERASATVGDMKRCMWSCGHVPTRPYGIYKGISESKGFLRDGGKKLTTASNDGRRKTVVPCHRSRSGTDGRHGASGERRARAARAALADRRARAG